MSSLLVTNDFPPKVGGIQSYLYELWRRLPPEETTVLTTPYPGDREFDAAQPFRIERVSQRVIGYRSHVPQIDALARDVDADVVFIDPAYPAGRLGRRLRSAPYVLLVHGAELTVLRHYPITRLLAARSLRRAAGVVTAGGYPAEQARRTVGYDLPGMIVPPGVDAERFRPLEAPERHDVRRRFGLDPDRPLVLGVSRLVPRKGFDVLIDAVAGLADAQLAIAGFGRDRDRLQRRAPALAGRVRFLGHVPDLALAPLYACADVFAMPCRERWGGLEAEGFGIVFLEAAACGVPAVAGRSGGSHEAVADGETGFVVAPREVAAVRDALATLLSDDGLRARMGHAARARAVTQFSYDRLVERLAPLAAGDLSVLKPLVA